MNNTLANAILSSEKKILGEWMQEQSNAVTSRKDLLSERGVSEHAASFLKYFGEAIQADGTGDIHKTSWTEVKGILKELSQNRARAGFTPSETAIFVFSLKTVLLKWIRVNDSREAFIDDFVKLTMVLDKLGLYTTEIHQKSREEIIKRQQADMLELSTPVVELAPSIIALPLIGTLDSQRAQTVMETLLESIIKWNADIAIIDITGVPTVDTLVAQHLMKTVAAARLMGADCIISGIRPQIAQTIVQLGLDLGHIHTKASLADAFKLALKQQGLTITAVSRAGSAK